MEIKSGNKAWTAALVAGVVIAAGALVWLSPAREHIEKRVTGGAPVAEKKKPARPEYEFGAPADVLAEKSPMAAAMVGDSEKSDTAAVAAAQGHPTDGAAAIEARVKTTRDQFAELKRVNEQYRRMPTQALRDRGNKLKNEVLTSVSGLLPLARRYNYRAGIDEAQAMRREALAMSFK